MRSLVCPNIAHLISAQLYWNVVHCTAVIDTDMVCAKYQNMCKLKGILLTNEILRDLRLRWVSDGYPPTLDSPVGARCFQLYRVRRPKPAVTEIFARGVFFPSLLQSNMKSFAIFEKHRWSILLISILLISMIAPLHIFMLYIHPWARVVFNVQLHQLMRYTYPNIVGVCTAESLT